MRSETGRGLESSLGFAVKRALNRGVHNGLIPTAWTWARFDVIETRRLRYGRSQNVSSVQTGMGRPVVEQCGSGPKLLLEAFRLEGRGQPGPAVRRGRAGPDRRAGRARGRAQASDRGA